MSVSSLHGECEEIQTYAKGKDNECPQVLGLINLAETEVLKLSCCNGREAGHLDLLDLT